jgi:hypothetical protein
MTDELREQVRERYAAAARGTTESACEVREYLLHRRRAGQWVLR